MTAGQITRLIRYLAMSELTQAQGELLISAIRVCTPKPSTPIYSGNRREVILRAIRDITAERGFPPSVREIAERVGLKSPSSVHHHLRSLAQSGAISRNSNTARAITLETVSPTVETR